MADEGPRSARRGQDDLVRLIDEEWERLDDHRRDLSEMRRLALSLRTAGLDDDRSGWQRIPDDRLPATMAHFVESAELTRSLVMTLDTGPGLDESAIRTGQRRMSEGARQRCIYPSAVLESAAGQRWIHSWRLAGEEQRMLADPPTEFAVFDERVAVIAADWGSLERGYRLVEHPTAVATLAHYFDALYAAALPIPFESERVDDNRQLLELLALGMKDESIARYLGWSLRTVRRRVATLMDGLGAQTRFQLGAAAQRQGLLGEGLRDRPHPGTR
ncbi:MAG: hypothetical protein LWW86_14910 [Micrococcales bacterium]|nr:hypothetical protein [Micrococcales bacterium]